MQQLALPMNKFYAVTVRRPKRKRDGTMSVSGVLQAVRYCAGGEEVLAFIGLALVNSAQLKDIKVVPISEAVFAKHKNPHY